MGLHANQAPACQLSSSSNGARRVQTGSQPCKKSLLPGPDEWVMCGWSSWCWISVVKQIVLEMNMVAFWGHCGSKSVIASLTLSFLNRRLTFRLVLPCVNKSIYLSRGLFLFLSIVVNGRVPTGVCTVPKSSGVSNWIFPIHIPMGSGSSFGKWLELDWGEGPVMALVVF